MLVGIGGYAQSGKDTAAQTLVSDGFNRVGFADPMREMLAALNPIVLGPLRYRDLLEEFGYEESKRMFPEFRRLLQCLGTEAGRQVLGQNIWVDTALGSMIAGEDYVVSDVRFPNEVAGIRDSGGLTLWVSRPGVGPLNDHASETSVSVDDFDVEIKNDGTPADLEAAVRDAVGSWMVSLKEEVLSGEV